jgi:hypothetical protein
MDKVEGLYQLLLVMLHYKFVTLAVFAALAASGSRRLSSQSPESTWS